MGGYGAATAHGRSDSFGLQLGRLAGCGGDAAVSEGCPSSEQLVQTTRLRDGNFWGYGLPYSRSRVQFAEAGIAGFDSERGGGAEWGELGARFADPLRFCGDGIYGGEDDAAYVVRRRSAAVSGDSGAGGVV